MKRSKFFAIMMALLVFVLAGIPSVPPAAAQEPPDGGPPVEEMDEVLPLEAIGEPPVELVVQAFSNQSGFPRTEPHGSIHYGSPTVVDLNGDKKMEVLTADGSGCVWGWDRRGKVLPGFPWKPWGSCSGTPRINGPLAVGDVDGDGKLEVVAGTRGMKNVAGQLGRVYVWNHDGSILKGWPKEMVWDFKYGGTSLSEVYSVALANVTGDGKLEVIAGTSNNASSGGDMKTARALNLFVYQADGSVLPGYPTGQRTAGIYGLVGAANLVGDQYAEVVTGRDHPYLHTYNAAGKDLSGWPIRTYADVNKDTWNKDLYMEFTNNAQAMGDLDGDGKVEIVASSKVKSPQAGYTSVHSGLLVVEPNGQRRSGWQVARLNGGPLAGSFQPSQAPALADLDGDGKLEIVAAFYDGKIRAYRENGTKLWEYDYAVGRKLYGSEPAIGDVTGDGKLDVIFGTYSPDGSANSYVRLIGLDARGQLLPNFPLALTHEGNADKKGMRAGPTLADLDGDGDVEILATTLGGTLYAWDLPAPYDPQLMPWPTSRHDNYRSGYFATSGPKTYPAEVPGAEVPADVPMTTKTYLPFILSNQ